MQHNKKTYYYQQPIALLKYLKKYLGTPQFDEEYFKEGMKKENIYIETEKSKYELALRVALEHHDSLQLNFKAEHWNKLVEHTDILYLSQDSGVTVLSAFLFCVLGREKKYDISPAIFSYIVRQTINRDNENTPAFVSALKSVISADRISKTNFFDKIWPLIDDKDWFINYLEKQSDKDFYSYAIENENIKIFKEKKNLENLIDNAKEIKPSKI